MQVSRIGSSLISLALLTGFAQSQCVRNGDVLAVNVLAFEFDPSPDFVRLHPATGAWETLVENPGVNAQPFVFDPFRAAFLWVGGTGLSSAPVGGPTSEIAIDRSFIRQHLAAVGDGRVFFVYSGTRLAFLDAANIAHDVVDPATGVAVELPSAPTALHYDENTNAVFVGLSSTFSTDPETVYKVALSEDGTEVTGVDSVDIRDSGFLEEIVSIGPGPEGTLYVQIDVNSNDLQSRARLVDPETMAWSVFAESGYFRAGGTDFGLYLPPTNRAYWFQQDSDGAMTIFERAEGDADTVGSATGLPRVPFRASNPYLVRGAGFSVDLAEPCGVIDELDLLAFIGLVDEGDPAADIGPMAGGDGSVDFFDLIRFLSLLPE